LKVFTLLPFESSHVLDDNYLVRILDILKHPHKIEKGWLDRAEGVIENSFKVKFPEHKKHFLYRIADFLFSNKVNQRMRRGMLNNVGEYGMKGFVRKVAL
jgi:hypothetical protein